MEKVIKIGIGFATGRKSFQNVLKTYINNWNESGLIENEMIRINLYIAYDLSYHNTKITDYTKLQPDIINKIEKANFIGDTYIEGEINYLIKEKVLNAKEANMIFGKGYAAKRNAILYNAIKNKMDYLIFLDDDEYPVAVTKTKNTAIWGGQHVLATHLKYISDVDITHGNHCGYISPIPNIEFNDLLNENDFRLFIEAISNDIINWEKVKNSMNNGGVTYADTKILTSEDVFEIPVVNKCKFISGANLCINLTRPERVYPFYNPPGARGEDTFLSTCLGERKVLRVPCYTFHDGFSTYNHLLQGVLPINLKFIKADNEQIISRFYKACIGWIRYKPLLLYITQPEAYNERIQEIIEKLRKVLPKVCEYFDNSDFMNIILELEKYHEIVEEHYNRFNDTQLIWSKVMKHFNNSVEKSEFA